MLDHPDQERIYLSYEGATFRRSLIFLLLALALLFAFELVHFPRQSGTSGAVTGSPLAKIFLGIIIAFLFLFGLADGAFVTGQRLFARKISFDDFNLYISRRKEELTVPLASISAISLTATSVRTPTRGILSVYRITYSREQHDEYKLFVRVFPKTSNQFDQFTRRVRELNPDLKLRQWAAGMDWLFANKK